jgi:hypothetical protein
VVLGVQMVAGQEAVVGGDAGGIHGWSVVGWLVSTWWGRSRRRRAG